MLRKLEGIVLRQVKYADQSRILNIYSREEGKTALFVNQVGIKKKGNRNYLVQPLSIVEFIISGKKEGKSINRIKEFNILDSSLRIRDNIFKTTIAMFIAEVIGKSIKEEEGNSQLYEYLRHSIHSLDSVEENIGLFPLQFVIQLTFHLGFQPDDSSWDENCYFDLVEGEFKKSQPLHIHTMDPEMSMAMRKLMYSKFGEVVAIPAKLKRALMNKMIEYYQHHLPNFGELKSHLVLQQVLS